MYLSRKDARIGDMLRLIYFVPWQLVVQSYERLRDCALQGGSFYQLPVSPVRHRVTPLQRVL